LPSCHIASKQARKQENYIAYLETDAIAATGSSLQSGSRDYVEVISRNKNFQKGTAQRV